jgi:hypothetical protein
MAHCFYPNKRLMKGREQIIRGVKLRTIAIYIVILKVGSLAPRDLNISAIPGRWLSRWPVTVERSHLMEFTESWNHQLQQFLVYFKGRAPWKLTYWDSENAICHRERRCWYFLYVNFLGCSRSSTECLADHMPPRSVKRTPGPEQIANHSACGALNREEPWDKKGARWVENPSNLGVWQTEDGDVMECDQVNKSSSPRFIPYPRNHFGIHQL